MRAAHGLWLLQAAVGIVAASSAIAASLQDVASLGYATSGKGTTGGKGGKTIHVSSLEQLEAAVKGSDPAIVVITGQISGIAKIRVGSNKSIIGSGPSARIEGVGFLAKSSSNLIFRNFKISKVTSKAGDAITIQASRNVWLDHLDLSSDRDHGKDYYDGLLDITHGSDFITVSNCKLHDHFKASLVGHSNKNDAEDTGHLRVTFANNYWLNINSRSPSIRFGTIHVFDSVFVNVNLGINVRQGARALVEHVVFDNSSRPLYSVDEKGDITQRSNDLGGKPTPPPGSGAVAGSYKAPPYSYQALPIAQAASRVKENAGVTLRFP